MTRTIVTLALGLTIGALAPTSAVADQAAPRPAENLWDLWAGCWTLTDETTDDGSATIARLLGLPAPKTKGPEPAKVCVTTDGARTATLATTLGDRPALTETVIADGAQHPLADADCKGWQRAEWSTLGPRLFASAETACGTQSPRKVSGLSMMIAGPTWIDIQMVEADGQKNIRVRRYRRAADAPGARRPTSSRPLLSRLTFPEVKEASAKVAPEAMQALLLELRGGFDLNSKRLIELADAGVSRGTIDLMVALSFPQKFVVDRPSSSGWSSSVGGGGGGGSWGFDDFDQSWPFYASPYLFTSYYAPFGYNYWGYYDNRYFTGPGFVVINPNPGSGGGVSNPEPSGTGRVVVGLGYTRVRRNVPEPSNNGSGISGFSTASSSGSSSGSGSSGSNSGGVSSSGYSGGSSGSSSGGGERTAQPRPPGGN
jgi:hypothetical protein